MSKARWKNFNGNDDECNQHAIMDGCGGAMTFNFEFETADQSIGFNVEAATETEAWERLEFTLDCINDDLMNLSDAVYIFRIADIDDFQIQQE
jgi:hypothetical protein